MKSYLKIFFQYIVNIDILPLQILQLIKITDEEAILHVHELNKYKF